MRTQLFTLASVLFSIIIAVESATIPSYIKICKRDQDTISDCVRNSIEVLRPKLVEGIPELRTPGLEPLIIPELNVDQGNVVRFKAVGRDVKVYGASAFKIKSLSVDLDNLQIRARVYFPKLEIEGKYDLDARLLVLPIHGKGDIKAVARKCDAEVVIQGALEKKNGEDYLKFTSVSTVLDMKDYSVTVDNIFNGDIQMDQIANQALENNKLEFWRISKEYVERTVSSLVRKIANRIAGSAPFDEILPEA